MRDDLIGFVSPGDRPSADRENRLYDAMSGEFTGVGAVVDATGVAMFQRPTFDERMPHRPTSDVPAYGVMVCNEVEDPAYTCVLKTSKTTTLGERPIYVNCQYDVASGGIGRCIRPTMKPIFVAYDTSDGTPAAGEVWGPVPDSYLIRKGFPGFLCLAAGDGSKVRAVYDSVEEPSYIGKLVNNLSGGGSDTTFSVYYWTGTTWSDSSLDATVYSPETLPMASTIVADKMIRAKWSTAARRLEIPGAAQC